MGGRILSLQRQARELGRLRTGYTDGKRPARSGTWIVTSHSEDYIVAAADQWGGEPEKWQPLGGGPEQWRVVTTTDTLSAILPAGDPLSQSYELWSGGGCARRCDGTTDFMSNGPCVCLAQHGDLWYEQPKGVVCSATTRLNVFLPDMPDVGVWRVETHSYYAASEIAGAVDLIHSTTGGSNPLPIRLRIEQRQRKAHGQTKRFPVVVVELRGITTGQLLSGGVQASQIGGRADAPALAVGPSAADWGPATDGISGDLRNLAPLDVASVRAAIAAAKTVTELREMWSMAKEAGLTQLATERAAEIERAEQQKAAQASGDPDDLWASIMTTVPEEWSTPQIDDDFERVTGVDPAKATAEHMNAYLAHLASTKENV
jgi:hypothetical protein